MTLEDLTNVGLSEFIEDALDDLLSQIAGGEEFYDEIHRVYLASAMLRTRLTTEPVDP